jgi:adenylate cyclase class IV
VVLREDEPLDVGVREAEDLMAKLQVHSSQLIERAYVDLLAEKNR